MALFYDLSSDVPAKEWYRSFFLLLIAVTSITTLDRVTQAINSHEWITDTGVANEFLPPPARPSNYNASLSTISPTYGRCDIVTWDKVRQGYGFPKYQRTTRSSLLLSKTPLSTTTTDEVAQLATCAAFQSYQSGDRTFEIVKNFLLLSTGVAVIELVIPRQSWFFGSMEVRSSLKMLSAVFALIALNFCSNTTSILSSELSDMCGADGKSSLKSMGYTTGSSKRVYQWTYYVYLVYAGVLIVLAVLDTLKGAARDANRKIEETNEEAPRPNPGRSDRLYSSIAVIIASFVIAFTNVVVHSSSWYVKRIGTSASLTSQSTKIVVSFYGIARCDVPHGTSCDAVNELLHQLFFAAIVAAALFALALAFTSVFVGERSYDTQFHMATVLHILALASIIFVLIRVQNIVDTPACGAEDISSWTLGKRWVLGDTSVSFLQLTVALELGILVKLGAWKLYY